MIDSTGGNVCEVRPCLKYSRTMGCTGMRLPLEQIANIILAGALIGASLGAGLLVGYLEGYADGVNGGFNPGLRLDTEETAEYHRIDGYGIQLQYWNSSDTGHVGYTTGHNDIHIRANRSIPAIYTTCVHEKLHNQYPNAPHSWIYQEARNRVDRTCLKLLTQIESYRPSSTDST